MKEQGHNQYTSNRSNPTAAHRDDAEALAMWREAMKEQGKRNDLGDNFLDNVKEVKAGNSREYTLSRLKSQKRNDLGDNFHSNPTEVHRDDAEALATG